MPFYIAAVVFWQKGKRFHENCTKTAGRVISIDEKGSDLIIRIEYKDTFNKTHIYVIEKDNRHKDKINEERNHDPRSQKEALKIGETIDIFYNRDKPEESVMGSPKSAYAPAIMCAVFASFPIVFEVIPSLF
jgi:hypothetical protein